MDTITLMQLVNLKPTLDNIFSEKMNPDLAFKFLKLLKRIQSEYDSINETQRKFLEDYPGEDFNSKFNDFLVKSTIDISDFQKIFASEIRDSKINVSPVDLNNLLCFIIED